MIIDRCSYGIIVSMDWEEYQQKKKAKKALEDLRAGKVLQMEERKKASQYLFFLDCLNNYKNEK